MPLVALWVVFLVVWKLWPSPTIPRDSTLLCAMLYGGLAVLLYNYPRSPRITTLALIALAFGFAAWSRFELGDNWSGAGERVSSGPYALFAHPIYIAVAVAVLLTALEENEALSYVAAASSVTALAIKAGQEEGELSSLGTALGGPGT